MHRYINVSMFLSVVLMYHRVNEKVYPYFNITIYEYRIAKKDKIKADKRAAYQPVSHLKGLL